MAAKNNFPRSLRKKLFTAALAGGLRKKIIYGRPSWHVRKKIIYGPAGRRPAAGLAKRLAGWRPSGKQILTTVCSAKDGALNEKIIIYGEPAVHLRKNNYLRRANQAATK